MAEEENNTPEAPETEPEKDNTVAEETPAAEVATEAPQSGGDQKQEDAPAESEKAAAEGGGKESKEGAPDDQKKDEKRDIFAEIMGEEAADAVKIHKAKSSKNVSKGIIHVAATFNNTMVTVTDQTGNTIGWSSSGKMGFKGSRKSTAYAAQVVSQDACRQAMGHGLKEAEVRVKGPGAGRESAVRAVQAIGIDVSAINDVTPIPHNGCRPKKARRV
ncbi:MAG: 30S ribosomal protein S11 [Roseibacillus sp.]|nr:30S ribosomal protein S11 [Roseibacillus sp.]|tara:strand:- start:7945 stop:8595 length:651 start_codon:yes stop_codon:yes gene_type:complete